MVRPSMKFSMNRNMVSMVAIRVVVRTMMDSRMYIGMSSDMIYSVPIVMLRAVICRMRNVVVQNVAVVMKGMPRAMVNCPMVCVLPSVSRTVVCLSMVGIRVEHSVHSAMILLVAIMYNAVREAVVI